MKSIVVYFSASGITAKVAEKLSDAIGADLFEIRPQIPYMKEDLYWMDKNSRSSVEMSNLESIPAIKEKRENMGSYDTILVGFPIWWYVAPTIINTFLESYDFSGKKLFRLQRQVEVKWEIQIRGYCQVALEQPY